MLGIPAMTPYDVRFRLLGIPVRVHPLFWIITAILGWRPSEPKMTLIWIVVVFISIMIHEFGHGLTAMAFGFRPIIVLHGMGGLCISEGRRTQLQQFLIVLAGPLASIMLFLVALVIGVILNMRDATVGPMGRQFLEDFLLINAFWTVVNLLPILPLDGGQLTTVILSIFNPRNGLRWAHVVSLVTSAAVAMFFVWLGGGWAVNGFLFAFFALYNFQALQAMHQQAKYGGTFDEDEADWWKR
jgi:stage IV sporulation protein FB